MRVKNLPQYFLLLILTILVVITFSKAQIEEVSAQLEGKVMDIDQDPIAEAEIQLKNEESGRTFHAESSDEGFFVCRFLSPGKYLITVEKEGYKSYSGEMDMRPNAKQRIEITLVKEQTERQKMEKQAISCFKKGTALAEQKKIDEAIQEFRKAVELKPDFAEAYLNLGVLLFNKKKDDEAEKALLKALELKPEESMTKNILAEIYFEKAKNLYRKEKIEETLEKLQVAYDYRPDHPYVNYLLGYIYYKKEMKDEAVKHLEAFIQLEPNAPQVKRAEGILEELKK
ncbi:MAG: tetratricopeptide repeat protein [Candidatus Aminicenantes bacterium]